MGKPTLARAVTSGPGKKGGHVSVKDLKKNAGILTKKKGNIE